MKNLCAIASFPLLSLAASFGGCATTQQPAAHVPALYQREVNQKNPGGKDLVMKFEELHRDEKTSTAKVTFTSGASVPSSLWIAQSIREIARARGARYFIVLREECGVEGACMYVIGFSQDKDIDPQAYFGLSQPFAGDGEDGFMDVKTLDMFFGKQVNVP